MKLSPFLLIAIFFSLHSNIVFSNQEIESLVPKASWISEFDTRLALARIFTRLEKRQEALELYAALLQEKPDDVDVVIETGRLYLSMKRFSDGLNLLYSSLNKDPANPSLLLATAQGEVAFGHAKKARILFLAALDVSTDKESFLLAYADGMMMWGDFFKAEAIYRRALAENPELMDLKLKLAWSFEGQQRYEEAEEIYRDLLLEYPNDQKIFESLTRLKIQEKDLSPAECFVAEEETIAESSQDLYDLANTYLQKGNSETALTLLTRSKELDPEYFPGQIALAETLSIFFCYEAALEIYQTLLDSFPENAKLMLAEARIYAWSKNYQTAIESYDRIIWLSPENPVPYKEKARTALWDKRFELAMETYDLLLERPVESFSDSLIHSSVSLEKQAKTLNWNKRYLGSLPAYEEWIEFNPGNTEALFDYAQINCGLGLCLESRAVYEHILEMEPNHSLAKMALERNESRDHIGLQANFTYWREIGSGSFSASQIARYRLDEVIEVPLSCKARVRLIQQEYLENPFYNYKFYPAIGQTLEAYCIFNERASGIASVSYKNYFGKFNSTFTTHNRLLFTVNDYLKVLLSYDKEDEIYNYFSLLQGTQSHIGLITLSSQLTRYWDMSGTCQYYSYNDDNSQIHYNLLTTYQLTEGTDVFKLILQGDYRNAAHLTISNGIGSQLTCMTHPYWTPDRYFSGSLTLQWRHDYREFEYCEGPQRYFDVKLTGMTDNANNPSLSGIVEWKHEFDCHFGFEIKGYIQRGPLWNAEGAWGTLSYRF